VIVRLGIRAGASVSFTAGEGDDGTAWWPSHSADMKRGEKIDEVDLLETKKKGGEKKEGKEKTSVNVF